ncbi:uncharacterized protein LTHEOB_10543 [Lasiodiplodia theobromae]|uniref:uncharacterized protein n=1 Tax=Lasiodiplodia theobromae TaxID=45133 RepID=UPI0015C2DB7E|nr:uncharacterized protein LTHEOB_10543 [Lasiodiplodia theobromae]KAF4539151.1 hypothetical protein LTHEOB_10543 [Lasiodiplodia theobromae]
MAEAIGVVSGVITFIDAGKKVLDLCTRIKDAPEKIAAYQQHLEDALFNVENLKQRLQSNTNPNISIARKDLDFVDNLLIRCTEHLLALQQTLGYLDNEFKGGRRRHAWASLVAVRRSGEILGIFSKLQNGLNSLKSFLIQQNFWMLQGQSSAVAAVQTSLADLKAIQSQNMQDLEQGFATTSQRSAEYVVQELNRMLQSQTSEIIPKLDAIYAVSAFVVSADFGGGGISISPAIKFPATIVDRTESEGFRLLDSLVLEYKDNYRKVYDTPKSPKSVLHFPSRSLDPDSPY